jgi:UDP-N-acetylglucosamine--N-acetylmuramyl-(pentapeptide) pyrophosphoryl-undecaprenol N-acetylglucosamine transferase
MPKMMALLRLVLGVREAKRVLRALRPGAVVGFGGYASVPPLIAASRLGIPTALHEQNAVLGRANRLLARRVDHIATSFPTTSRVPTSAARHVICTGNPVRPALAALGARPYQAPGPNDTIRLLVVGGSQGAQALSTLVPAALESLPVALRARLSVVQQCRLEDLQAVIARYNAAAITAECARFFDDMAARLDAAHLVIARSGASTVAELAAAGRPAILIPYPHAMDDHQSANAHALEAVGAAWCLPQATLNAPLLATTLEALFSAPLRLADAASAAHGFAKRNAAHALADLVEHLIGESVGRATV